MAKPNDFDIPRVFYFESDNYFTGSRGDFNFRIDPKDGIMTVKTWHGFICSEMAEIEAESEFPVTEEGHAQMLAWLETMYRGNQE